MVHHCHQTRIGQSMLICFSLTLYLYTSTITAAQIQKPVLLTQTGHSGSVTATAFSPDGFIIATASLDKTIILWEAATRREIRRLEGHTDGVLALAFSPNGKEIVSGANDGWVIVWDAQTGRELRKTQGHHRNIRALAISRDGSLLAVGGDIPSPSTTAAEIDDTLEILNFSTFKVLKKLDVFRATVATVAFSPDGRSFAAAGFMYSHKQNVVRLWDVGKWKTKHTLATHSDRITSLAFSQDSRLLASASKDATIQLTDVQTGRKTHTLMGHTLAVMSVAFSRDNHFIASGSEDTTVRLWDVSSGQFVEQIKGYGGIDFHGSHALAFSPDGQLLAFASDDSSTVNLWNLQTKRVEDSLSSRVTRISSVHFGNDARSLFTLAQGDLAIWDLSSGQFRRRIRKPIPKPGSATLSDDGKWLAAGNEDLTIDVLDVASGTNLRKLQGHPKTRSDGSSNYISDIDFFGRRLLATSDADAVTKIWDLTTGREIQTVHGSQSINGTPVSNHTHELSFSPDGLTLAAGTWGSAVELWHVATGRKVMNLSVQDKFGFTSVAFSPDGLLLASGTSVFDNDVKLWNAKTGELVWTLQGHSDGINDVAFSSDGKLLASAGDDKTVRIWDVNSGQAIRTLGGFAQSVHFICFSPGNRFLLAGSGDGIHLMSLTTGEPRATLVWLINSDDWLVATPEGFFDGSSKAWSQFLWRFSTKIFDVSPVEVFFNEYYYPGLLADMFAGKQPQATSISDKDRRQSKISIEIANVPVDRSIKLKVVVTDAAEDEYHRRRSGARDVRLFRNGSLVKVWHGDLELKDGKATLEVSVPIVAGENRFTAYAFNHDNIKSEDATLMVTGPESLRRQGTAYVVAVGVNSYANPQYNLKYAVADAKAFGEEFGQQQKKLGRFARVEVIPLIDKEATKANILLVLKRLSGIDSGSLPINAPIALQRLRIAQPEDVVVVYFAGHGTAQQNQFFLVPHDLGYEGSRTELDQTDLDTILTHSISDRELEQAFEQVDAAQVLLIIDACNSGQALEAEEKRRGPMNSKGLAQLAYEKGMYILTASQSYQAALETPQHGHGYLTYALVEEGLKTANADLDPHDGQVNIREWLDYATQRVPQLQQEDAQRRTENIPPARAQTTTQPAPPLKRSQRARSGTKNTSQQAAERARQLEREKTQVRAPSKLEEKFFQQPRVFYRREIELAPLVVAKP
jgi:WD40 repeat protein/uncharacterized caspase-like protein